MNQAFQEVVTDNPMLIEVSRVKRRMVASQTSALASRVTLALLGICYFGLLLAVGHFMGDLPPIGLIMAQTGLFALFAPLLLYGTIAGERERRSWDLLLAAPISKAQIVFGKFMGAMAALGAGAALFAIPLAMTALTYRNSNLYDVMLAETLSMSFLVMVCSFTIFISARVKRSLVALGTSLGVLASVFVVLPALLTVITQNAENVVETIWYANPLFALAFIMGNSERTLGNHAIPNALYGWPHIVAYLVLAAVFLVWSSRTLTAADNDHVRRSRKR